jgi:hypothetical protein
MTPILVSVRQRILQLYERGKSAREIAQFCGFWRLSETFGPSICSRFVSRWQHNRHYQELIGGCDLKIELSRYIPVEDRPHAAFPAEIAGPSQTTPE